MLTKETLAYFISPNLWLSNSPDFNLVGYKIWRIMQEQWGGPVRCSWQGIDRSMVASPRAVKIILIYNFIITIFGCQGGSHGGGISERAFALTRPGVAPQLYHRRFTGQNLETLKNQ